MAANPLAPLPKFASFDSFVRAHRHTGFAISVKLASAEAQYDSLRSNDTFLVAHSRVMQRYANRALRHLTARVDVPIQIPYIGLKASKGGAIVSHRVQYAIASYKPGSTTVPSAIVCAVNGDGVITAGLPRYAVTCVLGYCNVLPKEARSCALFQDVVHMVVQYEKCSNIESMRKTVHAKPGGKYFAYFATTKQVVDAMSAVLGFDFTEVSLAVASVMQQTFNPPVRPFTL